MVVASEHTSFPIQYFQANWEGNWTADLSMFIRVKKKAMPSRVNEIVIIRWNWIVENEEEFQRSSSNEQFEIVKQNRKEESPWIWLSL